MPTTTTYRLTEADLRRIIAEYFLLDRCSIPGAKVKSIQFDVDMMPLDRMQVAATVEVEIPEMSSQEEIPTFQVETSRG